MAKDQSSEMTLGRTRAHSAYMEFAKLRSSAKYKLATSGMAGFPLAELGITIDRLEINGSDGYGYEPLCRAIAQRYRVPLECVVPAAGTSMANYFALAACTEPGDEVLIEQPTYALLLDTAQYLGLEIKRFRRPPSADYQIDLADLERQISPRTNLIVLCNLHIHDLHAASNAFPAEVLGVIAFENLERIAAIQKARLDENRKLLKQVLGSQSVLDYFWPEHGTVVFPRLRNGNSEAFCDRLRKDYEVSAVPGTFFEDPQRIRIGVGGTTETVRPALEQLQEALKDFQLADRG